MKKLYSFNWDCGRMGNIDGLFIAEPEEVKAAVGKELYLGEVLGKHSEIFGTIEEGEIKEVDVAEGVVSALLASIGESVCGFNPIAYIKERAEEDAYYASYEN